MRGVPTFDIRAGLQPAQTSLDKWRDALVSLFDVEPCTTDFEASISSFALANLLIGQSAASSQRFLRDEAVIKRSQIDHMMVQLYLSGGFVGMAEGIPIEVESGDICCFDLAFGFETTASDFSNITMIIPKSALQPLTKSDHFHGLVLKSGQTANALLGSHMGNLMRLCPTIKQSEIEAATKMTAEVVRLCLHMPRRQRLAPEAPTGSLVERVRAFIGENLTNPDLGCSLICQTFAISRATLYRHFEPLGGVVSVIRNWRLSNVFGELERNRVDPLHVIARRNGFTSEVACARSFKSRYGLSPSSFRALRTEQFTQGNSTSSGARNTSDTSNMTRWIRELGRR